MKQYLLLFLFYIITLNSFSQNVYGIDLSHHNTVENWNNVTATFVYLKATEGMDYVDPTYSERVEECNKRNILVGAYHFMTTSSSPEKQFKNFKRTVNKKSISLIPVLDIERNKDNLSVMELRRRVKIFSELCKKEYGKYPIIYCSQGFYLKYFVGLPNDFWCGNVNEKVYIPHIIHQLTIKNVPGIKGKVDYNILNCNLKKIKL